ncbi:hypothetical protein PR048_024952 [Dryococelus australis]|uniref:Transposase n=1 Tax=Dryococelus australis TaxID=614101 RepID=A0ABQ9GPZ8_9NEOP|nr:hypothetical protein PR048_024952 [Dryococelus australis]
MEQLRNARAGEMGDPRENLPTSGIARQDSHMRESGSEQSNRSATAAPGDMWMGASPRPGERERQSSRSVADWPAQSPDLDPIEHLWGELDHQVRALQARPKSIAQLMEWLQEEWRRIPRGCPANARREHTRQARFITERLVRRAFWRVPANVVASTFPRHEPNRTFKDISHVGIVPDDAAGRWDFSEIFRFPAFNSVAVPYSSQSLSSALKTSLDNWRPAEDVDHFGGQRITGGGEASRCRERSDHV